MDSFFDQLFLKGWIRVSGWKSSTTGYLKVGFDVGSLGRSSKRRVRAILSDLGFDHPITFGPLQ